MPTNIFLTNQKTNYEKIINEAQEIIGLPNTDIEIETTNEFGAFSVINRLSQRRFFVYSPAFFDSVYSVTNTNFAIMSICFHELAHQYYRHPLKPNNASHIYEKQADTYSGYQMCLSHATLEQALLAIQNFGTEQETETHPDKASRIAAITSGYINARIKVFHDTTYREIYKTLKSNELMFALYDTKSMEEIESMSYSKDTVAAYTKKVFKKSKTKQLYTLYGELIYFTNDNKINLYTNNKVIGKILPTSNATEKMLSLDGVQFHLENNIITSVNPDGSKLEVGQKLLK